MVDRQLGSDESLGVRITGASLNRKHRLGLRHSLYHKDGTFYEVLSSFPAGLCDQNGYIRYETLAEFLNDPRLRIGRKVNVSGSIVRHPRYRRFGMK